ncbi:polysaccharide deacetylase family protein [Roseomonas sp. CCTCC AB2023176]|uniref:polysaccharide deacetylase family protein n=1 Tax=Roseomonas sp. CCTCC AB2023176 TaxID=3342640 RepID=UPI0035DFD22D
MDELGRDTAYPRDLRGYGRRPPDPRWPGGAAVAVSFVLNYEEGGEYTLLNGDDRSEAYLHESSAGALPRLGERAVTVESQFDYGARAGVWRILRLFEERGLPLTVYAVGRALELNPEAGRAFAKGGHEVASHAYRWIDYRAMPEEAEREDIARAVEAVRATTGGAPVGWYTGRVSERTRRLIVEHGGFLYDSDSYADDLPYYVRVADRPHLVIPYALDSNDMKFAMPPGFASAEAFTAYVLGAIEFLIAEGRSGAPRMLSVGLHARLTGRPGRAAALARILDAVAGRPEVWVCRRADIARHWLATHPPE